MTIVYALQAGRRSGLAVSPQGCQGFSVRIH